jgi:hypothetical protein
MLEASPELKAARRLTPECEEFDDMAGSFSRRAFAAKLIQQADYPDAIGGRPDFFASSPKDTF